MLKSFRPRLFYLNQFVIDTDIDWSETQSLCDGSEHTLKVVAANVNYEYQDECSTSFEDFTGLLISECGFCGDGTYCP